MRVRRGYGFADADWAQPGTGPVRAKQGPRGEIRAITMDAGTQRAALHKLASLTQRSVVDPLVRKVALQCVSVCSSREDQCELEAIFNAVKYGAPNVPLLANGFKYVADPNWSDLFTAPRRILEMLGEGANGGDCDDHTALICALAGSLGFTMGLRAYGRLSLNGEFEHVYAVAKFPKRGPPFVNELGMDTTVQDSYVGWQPPPGNILTAWLE